MIYLTEFFLDSERFLKNVIQKIKTYTYFLPNIFAPKSCHLWDNYKKCDRTREVKEIIIYMYDVGLLIH
jgi:hypothetical protein